MSIDRLIEETCPTFSLWEKLALDGKFELITLLRRVEMKEPGYGTVVVPHEGFSERDDIHNLVLDWLVEHDVNVLNVGLEVACLERALNL